ncbi:MAG: hypothetical protein V3T86_10825 [Planctomycetota bacterium]
MTGRAAISLVLALATAASAQSVDELRVQLQHRRQRYDALDEIARYWEGREELEPDVRALVPTTWHAAWALGMKPTCAIESIRTLVRYSRDPAARWALARLGHQAMPEILHALRDITRRAAMCKVLGRMGPAGRDAIYVLAPLAVAGDQHALHALVRMAPLGAPLLKQLYELDATDDAMLLCLVGPQALPKLIRIAEEDPTVRPWIEYAIGDQPHALSYLLKSRPGANHQRLLDFWGTRKKSQLLAAVRAEIQVLRGWSELPYAERVRAKTTLRYGYPAYSTLARIGLRDSRTANWIAHEITSLPSWISDIGVDALIRGDSKGSHAALATLVTNTSIDGGSREKILAHLAQRAPEMLKPKLARLVQDRSLPIQVQADLAALALRSDAADEARFRDRFVRQIPLTQADVIYLALALDYWHPVLDTGAESSRVPKSTPLRMAAIVALSHQGKATAPQREWLIKQAGKKWPRHAIEALARMPESDTVALEALLRRATHGDRRAFRALLRRSDAFTQQMLDTHVAAMDLCHHRGPRSPAELRRVAALFPNSDRHRVWPPLPKDVLDEARTCLNDGPEWRSNAAEFLGLWGTTNDIPILRRCLFAKGVVDAERFRIAAWDAIEAIEARAAR